MKKNQSMHKIDIKVTRIVPFLLLISVNVTKINALEGISLDALVSKSNNVINALTGSRI